MFVMREAVAECILRGFASISTVFLRVQRAAAEAALNLGNVITIIRVAFVDGALWGPYAPTGMGF